MKKIAVILFLGILVLTYFSFNCSGLLENVDKTNCVVGVYATGKDNDAYFDKCFKHGFVDEIFGVVPEIFYSVDNKNEVVGEFFKTSAENFDIQNFSNTFGLVVTKTSFVGEVYNIYARSALVPYKVNGYESNIQIAYSKGEVTVASPIIFGSY